MDGSATRHPSPSPVDRGDSTNHITHHFLDTHNRWGRVPETAATLYFEQARQLRTSTDQIRPTMGACPPSPVSPTTEHPKSIYRTQPKGERLEATGNWYSGGERVTAPIREAAGVRGRGCTATQRTRAAGACAVAPPRGAYANIGGNCHSAVPTINRLHFGCSSCEAIITLTADGHIEGIFDRSYIYQVVVEKKLVAHWRTASARSK